MSKNWLLLLMAMQIGLSPLSAHAENICSALLKKISLAAFDLGRDGAINPLDIAFAGLVGMNWGNLVEDYYNKRKTTAKPVTEQIGDFTVTILQDQATVSTKAGGVLFKGLLKNLRVGSTHIAFNAGKYDSSYNMWKVVDQSGESLRVGAHNFEGHFLAYDVLLNGATLATFDTSGMSIYSIEEDSAVFKKNQNFLSSKDVILGTQHYIVFGGSYNIQVYDLESSSSKMKSIAERKNIILFDNVLIQKIPGGKTYVYSLDSYKVIINTFNSQFVYGGDKIAFKGGKGSNEWFVYSTSKGELVTRTFKDDPF